MQKALAEAQKAYDSGEVPVGAIVVMDNKIISKAHNQVELLNDSTAHAEILALTSAYGFLGSKYLPDATLPASLRCTSSLAEAVADADVLVMAVPQVVPPSRLN